MIGTDRHFSPLRALSQLLPCADGYHRTQQKNVFTALPYGVPCPTHFGMTHRVVKYLCYRRHGTAHAAARGGG
jgi:hypothetical protein